MFTDTVYKCSDLKYKFAIEKSKVVLFRDILGRYTITFPGNTIIIVYQRYSNFSCRLPKAHEFYTLPCTVDDHG